MAREVPAAADSMVTRAMPISTMQDDICDASDSISLNTATTVEPYSSFSGTSGFVPLSVLSGHCTGS